MSALAEFSSLVALLYEAAAEPRQWESFVDRFHSAMEATHGALTAVAQRPELGKLVLRGYTEAEISAYTDYYCQHDLVVEAGLDAMKRSNQWIGRVEELVPYRELEASEIYNDYYRALDTHHASCLMMGQTGPYAALGLAAWRPKSSGSFSEEQLHLVELLAPHFKQAFSLHAKLNTLGMQILAIDSALNATELTVLALRPDGRLLIASPPAERTLQRGLLLALRGERLHAVNTEKDRTLQHLISCAARSGQIELIEADGRPTQPGGSFLLPQGTSSLPLQVQVLPVRSGAVLDARSPAVLVFVADPGAALPSRGQVLQELYKLSPLESRLADLFLQGQELKQAAEQLNLSYANTRFHLKQIFRKTGTTRQTELLRLLLAIPT